MASVHQEGWMEGEPVEKPEEFVRELRASRVRADIFAFSRRLPETKRSYPYYAEDDNLAAIPLTTYDDWWHKTLSRKARQEVSRAQRLGIVVRTEPWDEPFMRAIVDLFARIPTKQGLPFAYYGKDLDAVRREVSPYAERSAFLGAYHENRLVGYAKIVFMGSVASILNIICDEAYFEKRPANALIARAVETCCQRGAQYLVYGKYSYGNKTNDSLAEFKRRNGFDKIVLPRYYVALSRWGRLALRLRLHRGLHGLLPGKVILFLVKWRSAIYLKIVSGSAGRALPAARASGSNGIGDHPPQQCRHVGGETGD